MKAFGTKWFFAFVISTLLLTLTPAASAAVSGYPLTNAIRAELKSIVNERIANGKRIGAVIRLNNAGTSVVRIPDYAVRVLTSDKISYTLRASAANPKAIQPKETVELSYLIVVKRTDGFTLTKLSWVRLNEYVYPRQEQTMLSIPVSSGPLPAKRWEETFRVQPDSSLVFTPVKAIRQITPKGPGTVIILLAENKGAVQEIVPDFYLDGKSDKKTYSGIRVDQIPEAMEPGEKRLIHFAIAMDDQAGLTGLQVMIPESFVDDKQTVITYKTGRFMIRLPADFSGSPAIDGLPYYQMDKPIAFDRYDQLIGPDVEVSLAGLHLHKGEGGGFSTVIAKFKLSNLGDRPAPVPAFAAQIISGNGRQYEGARLSAAAESLAPGISYGVSYSFHVPESENGEKLGMMIMDSQTIAPYSIPIAAFQTKIQIEPDDTYLSLFPFRIKLNDWTMSANQLKLNVEMNRADNVVTDPNFSRLDLELTDDAGSVVASGSLPFTGPGRLINGWQSLVFAGMPADQTPANLTLRLYETVETPFGAAKRLVKLSRQ